jgi:DNA polymerase III subunit beta
MQVLLLRENLARALSIISRCISPRPQLPILSHILIKTTDGKLTLTATNLDIGIICTVAAKIEKEGEIAIPGKLLTEFITSLSAEKIELTVKEKTLIVTAGKARATFTLGNPADFPPFPQFTDKKQTLPFIKIKDTIQRAIFAASIDEGRPVLTGVRTKITEDNLFLSATDGYRLSLENVTLQKKLTDLSAILPAQSLSEIVRIGIEVNAEEMGISVIENKNQVVFTFPDVVFYTRLIDGEFPNIERIIPQGFKTRAIVDRDLLAQAVKTTSLFARSAANIIKIKVEKEGLRLSANTPQVGDDEDFIEAKVTGEETEIAFNYRFLADLLAHFPEKEVVFESSGPLSPGLFKPASGKSSFIHIIMPVRVQG